VDRILQWHAWAYLHRSERVTKANTGNWLGNEAVTVHIPEKELGARQATNGEALSEA
jgi:hypothetical protein